MELINCLQQLNLTKIEAEVYLTLLKDGEVSITTLSRRSMVKRSSVYLAIDGLSLKGLVYETQIGRKKYYRAQHPNRLYEIASYREKLILQALPQFVAIQKTNTKKPRVIAVEGDQGVFNLYNEIYESLSKNEEAVFITHVGALGKKLPAALKNYKLLLRRLKKPRIRELIYEDKAGEKWIKDIKFYLKNNSNHKVKIMPKKYEFGLTDMLILKDKLVIFTLGELSVATVIESNEAAQTFKVLFERVWESL